MSDFSKKKIWVEEAMTVGLVGIFTFLGGCAQEAPKADAGRLLKMSRHNRVIQNEAEQTRLRELMRHERDNYRRMLSKKFPLPKVVNEESLYSEVIRAFQARQIDAVDHYADAFLERYPQSVFADKAIYLKGQIHLILGFPAEALREFERVTSEYPTGNKFVAALFGKGVCYRKLQLYQYAEKVMDDVRRDYPGSPEFYKTELERKLIKVESETHES